MTTSKQVTSRSKRNRVPFSDQSNVLRMQSRGELQETKNALRIRSARSRLNSKLPNKKLPIEQQSEVASLFNLKNLSTIIIPIDLEKAPNSNLKESSNKITGDKVPIHEMVSNKKQKILTKTVDTANNTQRHEAISEEPQVNEPRNCEDIQVKSSCSKVQSSGKLQESRYVLRERSSGNRQNRKLCNEEQQLGFTGNPVKHKNLSVVITPLDSEKVGKENSNSNKCRKRGKKQITCEVAVHEMVLNKNQKILTKTGDTANNSQPHEAISKEPRNDQGTHINSFEEEINIAGHNVPKVPERGESSQNKEYCKVPKAVDKVKSCPKVQSSGKLQENEYALHIRSARSRQNCKLRNDELPTEQQSGVPSNPFKLKSVCGPHFDSKKVQRESNDLKQCQMPNKLLSRNKKLLVTKTKGSMKESHVGSKVVQNPVHNLRQIKPTNYMEDRSLSSPDETSVKENHVPIYRTKIMENPKPSSKEDLYDFIDTSPKNKKIVKNKRRSSILFDKNTYEILQRLQTNEEKSRQKALKKKKITYEATVNKIVSNMKHKILENTGGTANKSQQHEATSNQLQINKPRNDPNIIHVNNVEKEFNIAGHNLSKVSEKDESSQANESCKIPKDIDKEVSDKNAVQTRSLDTQDLDLIMLQSYGSCDNSVILRDLESGFGFSSDAPPTTNSTSTPVKQVNILSNLVLRPSHKDRLQSPVNLHMGNPNANSTMVQSASPWRTNWINIKRNPHLMSLKANALPNVEQEMVLDHTIVENYETHCSNTQKPNCTPLKKEPVQKSILDFVENNIDKENKNLQCSLYDYEDFNSPEKNLQRQQRRIQNVRRKVLGEQNEIDCRSIQQSNLLDAIGDKSNDSIENHTYFGFDQSTSYSSCNKGLKDDKAERSRFDLSTLKKYTRNTRHLQQPPTLEDPIASSQVNESVPILENSTGSTTENVGEIHLFEEPEEMLHNMESVYEEGKKPRRKRLHSSEMDDEDQVAAKRKAKKTKLETEQEAWIQRFNKMCEEIDNGDLIIE